MIWIIFALLTGIGIGAVLWPLSRLRHTHVTSSPALDFYKSEVERISLDLERGLLTPDNAQAMKTEAGRRLLREQSDHQEIDHLSARSIKWSSLLAIILIPLITLPLYLYFGQPDLPDMPLEVRLNAPLNNMDLAAAMARMEQHLSEQPNDDKALMIVAPIYLRLENYEKAAVAFRRLVELGHNDAGSEMGLATALVQLNQGQVDSETRQAYEAALSKDPNLYEAQYYIGLAYQQAGDLSHAQTIWSDLYRRSPQGAPWLEQLAMNLRDVGGTVPQRPDSVPQDNSKLNPAILSMVDRLASRLAAQPKDLDGWLQLIRSYKVLGEKDKFDHAIDQARNIFSDDQSARDTLVHQIQELK